MADTLLKMKAAAPTLDPSDDSEATLMLNGEKRPRTPRDSTVVSEPTIVPSGVKRLKSSAALGSIPTLGAPTIIGARSVKKPAIGAGFTNKQKIYNAKTLPPSELSLPFEDEGDDAEDLEVKAENTKYDDVDPVYDEDKEAELETEFQMKVLKGSIRSAGSKGLR